MGQLVNINGTWKTALPYVNISGSWKVPKSIYNKVSNKWFASFLQGGVDDVSFTDFDVYTGFSSADVNIVLVQSDGKILVGGGFSQWNNQNRSGLIRFNSDMTLDTTFNTNLGTAATTVSRISLQSDGKILVVGNFVSWNGSTANYILRLNTDGTRDTDFTTNNGTAANGSINTVFVQSDGKILIGGTFTSWNGTTANRLTRLNSNGTLDTTFNTNLGTGANSSITSISVQTDGKIVATGSGFTTWNGVAVGNIVRLNSDGTRDTTFTTNNGTGSNFSLGTSAIQSDGKILVGGSMTSWNGTTANRITRLNADGTLDTTFNTNIGTGANNLVYDIKIQTDGKIVVGGAFTTFNSISLNRFIRLNSNGTLDSSFNTNTGSGFNNNVNSIFIQSDNKIITVGTFTIYNNNNVNRITRVTTDGQRDTSFINTEYSANNGIISSRVQSDGKIIIGGQFTLYRDISANRIARINSDGTIDTTFMTNIGTAANNNVKSIAIQSDGKIIVGGDFTSWNGVTVGAVVRLNSDGTRDTAFTTNNGTGANGQIEAIAIQSDGKIILGGNFFTSWNGTTVGRIVRLNSDGTRDTTFTTNNGTGANGNIASIVIQSDGKIILVGGFFLWNGSTNTYRIARLNTDGTLDTAFATNSGFSITGTLLSVALQSDGKIIIGGLDFSAFNSTSVGRIARLNSDGTLDTAFTTNNGTGANGAVRSILVQSDGKIIIGGAFTQFGASSASRIARLSSNGTFESNFISNIGTGFNSDIYTINSYPDDRLLVSGIFTSFGNRIRNRISRIGSGSAY